MCLGLIIFKNQPTDHDQMTYLYKKDIKAKKVLYTKNQMDKLKAKSKNPNSEYTTNKENDN